MANQAGRVRSPDYREEDRGYATPCWVWLKWKNQNGYGKGRINGRKQYAHRAYFEAANGPLPEGCEPDHLCKVRECVRPDHMEAVSRKTNVRRSALAVLTSTQVEEVRARYAAGGVTQQALATEYGVQQAAISKIVTGRRWAA